MTKSILLVICVCVIVGCSGIPRHAFMLAPAGSADRQMQSRVFSTHNPIQLMKDCAIILENMGYQTDLVDVDIGLITATKHESKGGFSSTMLSILSAGMASTDSDQVIKATFTAVPSNENGNAFVTRLTLQRLVFGSNGEATSVEQVADKDVYKIFYERLEASTFIEPDKI